LQEENKPQKGGETKAWKIDDLICKEEDYVRGDEGKEYLSLCKVEADKEEKY
jgi:hypothetical protein